MEMGVWKGWAAPDMVRERGSEAGPVRPQTHAQTHSKGERHIRRRQRFCFSKKQGPDSKQLFLKG